MLGDAFNDFQGDRFRIKGGDTLKIGLDQGIIKRKEAQKFKARKMVFEKRFIVFVAYLISDQMDIGQSDFRRQLSDVFFSFARISLRLYPFFPCPNLPSM